MARNHCQSGPNSWVANRVTEEPCLVPVKFTNKRSSLLTNQVRLAKRPAPVGSAREFALTCVLLVTGSLGCSTQRSDLISAANSSSSGGGPGAADADVLGDAQLAALSAVVDERPIGGASLQGGTTGGGTLAAARAGGHLIVVHTAAEFLSAVSGDTPTVILINEGTYDFTLSPGRASKACTNPCIPNTPVAAETLAAASCATTASLFDVESTYDIARVGDNKTLVGLGAGAILKNVEIDLSGSSNIILRNLDFEDLNPGIFHDGEAL
jgi:hypothetical protein